MLFKKPRGLAQQAPILETYFPAFQLLGDGWENWEGWIYYEKHLFSVAVVLIFILKPMSNLFWNFK